LQIVLFDGNPSPDLVQQCFLADSLARSGGKNHKGIESPTTQCDWRTAPSQDSAALIEPERTEFDARFRIGSHIFLRFQGFSDLAQRP